MKIAAIIAEYNPFHNGHARQIQKIRETTGADYIVAAMSGDFVQRGAPAVVDKYVRAKMALLGGVDAVFELPALWATASAEYFAKAGVALFENMGCVDVLCFGVETDTPAVLCDAARVLTAEPDNYRAALAASLKEGHAFPAARQAALLQTLGASKQLEAALALPNNILALEYEKALMKCHSSITPYAMKREGAGYHDLAVSDDANVPCASAAAIRNLLGGAGAFRRRGQNAPETDFLSSVSDALSGTMPPDALSLLLCCLEKTPALCADDFSAQLGYLLLAKDAKELAEYADCNEKIANRLKKNAAGFSSFSAFCEKTKSRDVTYTRMSRIFTHLLLGVRQNDYAAATAIGCVPYLRLLGFKKSSEKLFPEIRRAAKIPIISKLSAAQKETDKITRAMLRLDLFAADLYCQTAVQKGGNLPANELTREIVILD